MLNTQIAPGPLVGMVSLGCPKNLVDSERIMGKLAAGGFVPTDDPEMAEVLIVNTCGFINKAKEESIDTLLEMSAYKESGCCRYLIATGCLTQRYADQLVQEMPEVDAWVGFNEYARIDAFLRELYAGRLEGVPVRVSDPAAVLTIEEARLRLTPEHYAYLRISEGCDKTCSFCSIPSIRGRFRSKPVEAVVAEARELVTSGARELNIISQDTLHYGVDTVGKRCITPLLEQLCEIDELAWIRLWYLYPGKLPEGLAEVVAGQPKILPYLDMPVQHAHPDMLRAMCRPVNMDVTRELLGGLRQQIPGLVLRTSFIVGFPGETDSHFESMLDFQSEMGFERLGVFLYSQEEGTAAGELPGQVPEEVKQQRYDTLMAAGRKTLERAHRSRVGGRELALVDGPSSRSGWMQARTTSEGPEVDPVLLLPAEGLTSGEFVPVRIEALDGVDLIASRDEPTE